MPATYATSFSFLVGFRIPKNWVITFRQNEKRTMRCTRTLSAPVVTLLSPSPAASRRTQDLLASMVGMEPVRFTASTDDKLDHAFQSFVPGMSRSWDSVVSRCQHSGTLIHFCSLNITERSNGKDNFLSLIGLTDQPTGTPVEESIQLFRDTLALVVEGNARMITIKQFFGGTMSPLTLLQGTSSGGLPILQLPKESMSPTEPQPDGGGLKELVIPFFDNAAYKDGSTLLSRIGSVGLNRPTVGVYQWPNSATHIRPLPTAHEDQRLPPPSIIFHHDTPEEVNKYQEEHGVKVAKIGYGGHRIGQLMLLHPDLAGIDIRVCPQQTFSSSFSESQESLLAASLDELQSTNTLLDGNEEGKDDDRIGNADCWIEVRANLKNPSGYWRRQGGLSRSRNRTAKVPNIPFE